MVADDVTKPACRFDGRAFRLTEVRVGVVVEVDGVASHSSRSSE